MKVGKYHSCPHYPDHPCEGCEWADQWGEREFCTYVPPRCALHECIKVQGVAPGKMCMLCIHWHKSLNSKTCNECIQTLELVNFKMQDGLPKEIFRMMQIMQSELDGGAADG